MPNPAALRYSLLALLCLLLAACTAQPTAAPTPSPSVAPSLPLDGTWIGRGQTVAGLPITITFSVAAERIFSLSYTYRGQNNAPCIRIDHLTIPPAEQPQVQNGRLQAALGEDFSLNAVFTQTQPPAASGEMAINWLGRPTCSASLSAHWTGERIAAPGGSIPGAASSGAGPARPASICGVGVNCAALLARLLILGLSQGAVLALIATGISLIYATVRILNLAHGDIFALTTALVTTLVNTFAIQPGWGTLKLVLALAGVCLAAVAFGALLSVIVEQIAFRPFRQAGEQGPGRNQAAPLIATLGISFILFQAALVWRTFQHSWIPGEHRSVPGLPEVPTDRIPDLLPGVDVLAKLGLKLPFELRLNDLLVILIAVAFALSVNLYLKRTRSGRSLRAFAQNPQLAQIVGINGQRSMRQAFALGGGLAGAAAFIFALYYARPFGDAGAQSGLLAFAAALLGGVGSPVGALLSGLLLGVLSAFSDYFLNAAWTPILLMAILIGLLALYPSGLGGVEEPDSGASAGGQAPAPAHKPAAALRLPGWQTGLLIMAAYPLAAGLGQVGGQMILAGIGIFAVLALGLNLAQGVAGVLDLGIAASFAVGAYAAAWVTGQAPRLDFGLVLLLGAGLGGLVGLIKGLLARRLHNNALAAATLALGLLAQKLVVLGGPLTGGSGGIGAIPPPRLFGLPLADPNSKYELVLLILLAAVFICRRLADSRLGRAWLAGSADEMAARANGIDVGASRQAVLLFSGLLAGAAGALQACVLGYVDPGTAAFHVSVMTLAIVILGGAGSVPGVLVGALLIIGYDKVIIPQLAAVLAYFWPKGVNIGPVPDLRGASFFNFGLALYLTVLLRGRPAPDWLRWLAKRGSAPK